MIEDDIHKRKGENKRMNEKIIGFEKIQEMLFEILGIENMDEITPDADLVEDLAVESIDFIDICFRLEKDYKLGKVNITDVFPEMSLIKRFEDASESQKQELINGLTNSHPHLKEIAEAFQKTGNPREFFKAKNIYEYVNYKLLPVNQ